MFKNGPWTGTVSTKSWTDHKMLMELQFNNGAVSGYAADQPNQKSTVFGSYAAVKGTYNLSSPFDAKLTIGDNFVMSGFREKCIVFFGYSNKVQRVVAYLDKGLAI